jgi:retron-type reverse transcriptase
LEEIPSLSQRTIRIVRIFLYDSNFSIDGRDKCKIENGCPQGSIISPLLFIIFFGKLLKRLRERTPGSEPNNRINAFADDLVY